MSRWSSSDLATETVRRGVAASISASTIRRWLTRGVLAAEISIVLCATALGAMMLTNLVWAALRHRGVMRARLADLAA